MNHIFEAFICSSVKWSESDLICHVWLRSPKEKELNNIIIINILPSINTDTREPPIKM